MPMLTIRRGRMRKICGSKPGPMASPPVDRISAWPPVLVDAVPTVQDASLAAGLGIAPRNDGTQQLTFQGAPLYLYVGDTQPGEITGDASDGVWFVVNVPPAV